LRGCVGSTALTEDELACKGSSKDFHRTHTSDFVSFIQFIIQQGLPKHSITLVGWSKGSSAILGLFYFQTDNTEYSSLINQYISSVVFYAPPASAVFGHPPNPTEIACVHARISNPETLWQDLNLLFSRYVTGFFKNSPEFLDRQPVPAALEAYRIGLDEPHFRKYFSQVYEGETQLASSIHSWLTDEADKRNDSVHDAFRLIAKSSVKRIGLFWGTEEPASHLEGCWQAKDWLEKERARDRVECVQFQGGNHYMQYYEPEQFWKIVLEVSA
jgi:pimeloyl-ACP methyl ester carboxylesterase